MLESHFPNLAVASVATPCCFHYVSAFRRDGDDLGLAGWPQMHQDAGEQSGSLTSDGFEDEVGLPYYNRP